METELVKRYPNGQDSTGVFEREEKKTPAIRIISAGQETEISVGRISTQDLYSNFEHVSPELKIADRLMAECVEHTKRAIAADREGERITADDAMQSVQGLIPELFCCRSLGEGFAIITNALLCAFQNMAGSPFQREQMDSIRRTLQILRTEPFVSAEIAAERAVVLEAVGLKIEPPEFPVLVDLLDE